MAREAWDNIKHSKGFYVGTYRGAITVLIWSVVLNILLSLGVYYTYFSMPEPDYYSTNGITPPSELTAMSSPNYTSTPLLASMPGEANDDKKLPN